MRYTATIGLLLAILCGCNPKSDDVQILVAAGRSFAKEHRYAEAQTAYEKALALDSLNAEPHYELGNLNARLGRLDAAAQAYAQP